MHQLMTHMLSICLSSWHACWVHAKVPYASAEGMQNEYLNNGKTVVHAELVHKELMRLVRVLVSSWSAQCMYQFLMHMLNIFWRDLFQFGIFTLMLRVHISSWHVCSACFEKIFSNFICAFSVRTSSWCICSGCTSVPEFLTRIRSEHACKEVKILNKF